MVWQAAVKPHATQQPPPTPTPRGMIFARAAVLIAVILVGYNLLGGVSFAAMRDAALGAATQLGMPDVSPTGTGVLVADTPVDLRLYWLVGALSLLSLAVLVFRPGWRRSLLGTSAALMLIVCGYTAQVGFAIIAVSRGHVWAGMVSSGILAWLLVLAEFMLAFLLQLSVMIAGRQRRCLDRDQPVRSR